MIELMPDVSAPAVGIRASGVVTAEDYRKVLIPALRKAFETNKKVRVIYVMGPEFESFEPGAMWQDTLFGLRHYFDFNKIAVVTDHETWASAVRMMAHFIPGAVRVYPMTELDAAKAWAVE